MAEQQSNDAVLGGGSFGTALASIAADNGANVRQWLRDEALVAHCLLYTSPSPRDRTRSRMPSSA